MMDEVMGDPPDSLELGQWLQHVETFGPCLTAADVALWPCGFQLPVMLMDYNVADVVCHDGTDQCLFAPESFFEPQMGRYTHETGFRGTLQFHRDSEEHPFTFHVKQGEHAWGPITSDTVVLPETRVGWRGPMIPWSRVAEQPHVFWDATLDGVDDFTELTADNKQDIMRCLQ